MKVFLGGTCAGYPWRDDLQPLLKCDYYNPIVENWSEEDRLREVHERETSDFVLYGFTNDISGVYSIAEVVDDSNKRPEKTLFLNLFKDYGEESRKKWAHSLKATENLLKSNGIRVFNDIKSIAEFLNNEYSQRKRMEKVVAYMNRSEKEKVIECIKEPVLNNGRNSSENWYNPYYYIKETFSLEQIEMMSDTEVENLVKLARTRTIGMVYINRL